MTNRGTEKFFLTVAIIAIVALGAVEVARVSGYLRDWALFVTLNIALPVLFLTMIYQLYLRRKHNSAAP